MPSIHLTLLPCGHTLEIEECTECLACGQCRPIAPWQDPLCASCYATEDAKPLSLYLHGKEDWYEDDSDAYEGSLFDDVPEPG